jgi:2-dehydropantoate 2-reductase
MKICIYGAGGIGGYLAGKLDQAGVEVSLVARGPHLRAIQENGLTLISDGQRRVAALPATDDPGSLGPQDYVIVTLKAPSVLAAAQGIGALLGPETAVVSAQNGVPWWYFYRHGGPFENRHLDSVDPEGKIWRALGPERAIGCVVYPSCEIVEPGVVRHLHGNRFMLGEPDGERTARSKALSNTLTRAGLKAPVRRRIRDDLWLKLWGNVSFNPVSVLTAETLREMTETEESLRLIKSIMREARAVAEGLGVKLSVDIEKRIQWAADVGDHKTSMLQDLEKGRPLELDEVVGAVAELGRWLGVPTPELQSVLDRVRHLVKI